MAFSKRGVKKRSSREGQLVNGSPIPEGQMAEGGLDAEKRGLKKVKASKSLFTKEKNRGPGPA